MAYRSAAHRPPDSGFNALRCALMPQQPPPFNQPGPSSGGAMTTGFRDSTTTGATFSSMTALISGGVGFGIVKLTVCTRSVGRKADVSSATSSQTAPPWAGPNFVALGRSQLRRRRGRSVRAGPVAELVSGQGEQRLVAGVDGHRRQRHLLIERVGQLQLVDEMGFAIGGGHRYWGSHHLCKDRRRCDRNLR